MSGGTVQGEGDKKKLKWGAYAYQQSHTRNVVGMYHRGSLAKNKNCKKKKKLIKQPDVQVSC